LTPAGTGPYLHLKETFAKAGLPMPEIAGITFRHGTQEPGSTLRIRGWMSGPMFDTERKAGLIDALPVEGLKAPDLDGISTPPRDTAHTSDPIAG
jgi:hypothetical protein